MNLRQVVFREIMYRKSGFILGAVSIAVATGVLVCVMTLLAGHAGATSRIMAEKEAATAKEMALMQDDYRKIMKTLGFNLLILPESQSLDQYYATGYVSESMPEDYAERLAAAGLLTVRHVLPSVERRIEWPEMGGATVILSGTKGEVLSSEGFNGESMQMPVAEGDLVAGYAVAKKLGLAVGQTVTLRGEKFRVSEINPEKGTRDDITVWIELARAQRMLGLQGRLNAILALKCLCAGNELSKVRKDVTRILPGTQVIEVDSKVVTRAEARNRAALTAKQTREEESANLARLRESIESLAAWLVPLSILGAAVWIGLLALANVRQRRAEIGIFRALGLDSGRIITVFLARAALIGLTGSVAGYAAGIITAGAYAAKFSGGLSGAPVFNPLTFLAVILAAPALAIVASWLPALVAAGQDPALVPRED